MNRTARVGTLALASKSSADHTPLNSVPDQQLMPIVRVERPPKPCVPQPKRSVPFVSAGCHMSLIPASDDFGNLFTLTIPPRILCVQGVQEIIREAVNESISNSTEKVKIFIRLNDHFPRQSPFQRVQFNFDRRIAVQYLKCHSKFQSPLQESLSDRGSPARLARF
jgi:hypothetical protein